MMSTDVIVLVVIWVIGLMDFPPEIRIRFRRWW